MKLIPQIHFSKMISIDADQAFHMGHSANITLLGREYRFAENESTKKLLFYPTSNRTLFHNPFLPILQVSFKQAGNGTNLILDARLRTRPQTVISLLILAGLLIEAGVLLFILFRHVPLHYYIFAPLAISCAVYLISTGSLSLLSIVFFQRFLNLTK